MPFSPYMTTVVPYDLTSEKRLSERHIHGLSALFRSFAYQAADSLSTFCHLPITASLQTIEQIPFSRYLKSLNQPTYLAKLDAHPVKISGFLEVNAQIAFSIAGKMLGGSGDISSSPHTTSGLEMAINRKFINLLLKQLSTAMRPMGEMLFAIDDIFTDTRAASRLFPSYELCAVASISINIQGQDGVMTVAIPSACLLRFLQLSDPSVFLSPARPQKTAKGLQHLEVELCAYLGQCKLTEKDILELRPDDIIVLDHKIDQPIDVSVSDSWFCVAKPGLKGTHRAVALSF